MLKLILSWTIYRKKLNTRNKTNIIWYTNKKRVSLLIVNNVNIY